MCLCATFVYNLHKPPAAMLRKHMSNKKAHVITLYSFLPLFVYLVPPFGYLVPLFGYLVPLFGYLVPLFNYLLPLFGYLVPLFG